MTAYEKGYYFERQVQRRLEGQGWLVVASRGSHGPADLVALRQGEVWLIQCRVDGHIRPAHRAQLETLARENRCRAFLVSRVRPLSKLSKWEEIKEG